MLNNEESINTIPTADVSTPRRVRAQTHRVELEDEQRCDFCGRPFSVAQSTLGGSERRKYCSKSCQSRASQGRIKARLAAPPSKRYAARLKFSNPLYFN